jgi:DNA-binding transcriptional ArsR family regulator
MTRRHTPHRLSLNDIIPHLRKARRLPDGSYMACCPAHDDSEPSLHLSESPDGMLLWHCHAGCPQDAVQRELERIAGVRPATARPIAPRRNAGRQPATAQAQLLTLAALANAKRLDAEKLIAWHVRELPDGGIEIPYLTREGELHAVQYRLTKEKVEGVDRFRWRQGDTPILYGLWRLCEWTDSDTLYLCEGTSDTWTLWHADLPALGIPSASTWREEWWREVEGFERIVLIPDADDAGAGLAQKLAETCPDSLRERVQVLRLPDGIKDANELWQREGANAERFRNALAECATFSLSHFLTLNTPEKVRNWQAEPIDLAEATPRPAEWLVKDLIPARHATNLYGDSGTGKSLIALYLALCVIEGIPFLNFPTTKRGKVLYLDLELDAEIHTLRWWAIARGAGYTTPPKGLRYVRWTQGLIGHEQALWELIEQEQPALLIVDSFGKATGKPLDPDLAIALYNLFDALPVPVLVIDHTAKPNPEIPAESAREYGTVYKRHYARSAIQVDLQGSERGHIGVVLRHQKSNFGRLAPEIPLTLAFLEEDGVLLEVRLQYGGQAVQSNAELFGRRGEVVRFLSENGEATQKQIAEGIDLSQGRVSIYLKQLIADGIVEEVPDTYPKRYRLLAITEDGSTYSVIRPINTPNNRISGEGERELNSDPLAGSYSLIRPLNTPNNRITGEGEPEPNANLHGDSYSVIRPLNSANNRISADGDAADLPDLFANRTPFESCISADQLDGWLQRATDDDFGLTPADADAVRLMLAYAEARGFPALVVDGYTIHGDMAGWLTAAQQLAGTPAVRTATRLLHALDASGIPLAPTPTTHTSGDAGCAPSQLPLLEG